MPPIRLPSGSSKSSQLKAQHIPETRKPIGLLTFSKLFIAPSMASLWKNDAPSATVPSVCGTLASCDSPQFAVPSVVQMGYASHQLLNFVSPVGLAELSSCSISSPIVILTAMPADFKSISSPLCTCEP